MVDAPEQQDELDEAERAALTTLAQRVGMAVGASALGLDRAVLERLELQGYVMRVITPARGIMWAITRMGARAVKEDAP